MTTRVLHHLLEPARLTSAQFVSDFFQKHPVAAAGAARFAPLGSWETIDRVIASTLCDVALVKEGRAREAPARPTVAEARAAFAEGYTIGLRHIELHDPDLAELARSFAFDLHGALNVHLYCAPKAARSYGWHCDPEEVFILQTRGTKTYQLRQNTLHPTPLEGAMPRGVRAEQESTPVATVVLREGEWLYVPAGWWHDTRADSESISISIGLLTPSWLDLLSFVGTRYAGEPTWRARLPPLGHAAPIPDGEKLAQARRLLLDLASRIEQAANDPRFVASVLMRTAGPTAHPGAR